MNTLNLLFLLLLLFPGHGFCEKAHIIMVTEHWPPFIVSDEGSPSGFRGIDIDIANKIAKDVGITIEIEHHPWARALEQVINGQADLITGIAYTSERAAFLHFIPVSYCTVLPMFYTRKSAAMAFADGIEAALRRLVDTGAVEAIQTAYS